MGLNSFNEFNSSRCSRVCLFDGNQIPFVCQSSSICTCEDNCLAKSSWHISQSKSPTQMIMPDDTLKFVRPSWSARYRDEDNKPGLRQKKYEEASLVPWCSLSKALLGEIPNQPNGPGENALVPEQTAQSLAVTPISSLPGIIVAGLMLETWPPPRGRGACGARSPNPKILLRHCSLLLTSAEVSASCAPRAG